MQKAWEIVPPFDRLVSGIDRLELKSDRRDSRSVLCVHHGGARNHILRKIHIFHAQNKKNNTAVYYIIYHHFQRHILNLK